MLLFDHYISKKISESPKLYQFKSMAKGVLSPPSTTVQRSLDRVITNQHRLFVKKYVASSNQRVENMASQSVVFKSGQKMALRAFYFIRTLTKALTYYYINRYQRHLMVAIENNRFRGPIETNVTSNMPDLRFKIPVR